MNNAQGSGRLRHSFVICTLNRPSDLKDAIQSLIDQSMLPDELVVVDASDNDRTRDLIDRVKRSCLFPVTYLHTRPGLTYQRNHGVTKATGDIIHFIDDDVILEPRYLEELHAVFSRRGEEDTAGAGGTVTNAPRLARFVVLLKKLLMLNHNYGSGRLQPSGYSAFGYNSGFRRPVRVQILGGCSQAYRKAVFKEFQFDEELPGYGLQEDVDFSYRVSRKHRLFFVPAARLVHNVSPAGRTKPATYFYYYLYNHFYLSFKNLPRTLDHIGAIWYSHITATLGILAIGVAKRSAQPVLGVIKAHLAIARDILKGIFGRRRRASIS